MATREQLERALINADKAGDVKAARILANELKSMTARPKTTGTAAGTVQFAGALAEAGGSLVDLPVQGVNAVIGLGARGVEAGARALGADGVAAGARRVGDAYETAVSGGGPAQRLVRKAIPVDARQWAARAAGSGIGGAAGGVGVGRAMLAAAAPAQRVASTIQAVPGVNSTAESATTAVARELAARPGLQVAAGVAGAGGSETARVLDASAPVQLLTGLAAGVAAPAGISGAGAIVGAAKRGVSRSGIDEAAAEILRNAANDRTLSLAALSRPPEALPGVSMTTAEVTQDAGLAGLARGLRSNVNSGARLSARDAENMAMRQQAAVGAFGAGNPDDVTRAATRRLGDLTGNLDSRIASVGPLMSPLASGERARGVLDTRKEAARAAASRLYKQVEIDEPLQVGAFDEATVVPDVERGTDFPRFAQDMEDQLDPVGANAREAVDSGIGLLGWIRKKGGIKPRRAFTQDQERSRRGDNTGWNKALNVKNSGVDDLYSQDITPGRLPGLYRNTGFEPDELAMMAVDERKLPEGATMGDFVDALIKEIATNGKRVTRAASENAGVLASELDRLGLDASNMTDEAWYRFYKGGVDEAAGPDRAPSPGRTLSKLQASLALLPQSYPGVEVGADISRIIKPIIEADGAVSVGEIAGRIQRLRNVSGQLSQRGQGANAAIAASMADALDGFIRTQATGQQATDLAKARLAWRKMKETFTENETGRALRTNQHGRFETDAASVPGAVVPKGVTGESAAQRLRVSAGPDEALQSAREELRRALDGADARTVAKVARDYRETLRGYPELRPLVKAAQQDAALLAAFPNTALGRIAGNVDPETAIKRLLGADDNGRGMRELAKQLGDNKQALAGVRRSLATALEAKSSGRDINAAGDLAVRLPALQDAVNAVLTKTKGTQVLEPEQRIMLMKVKSELGRANLAANANRTAGSDTARNIGINSRIGMAALRGVAELGGGKLIGSSVLTEFISKRVNNRINDIHALLTQAMIDPKLAAELLKRPTKERAVRLNLDFPQLSFGSIAGAAGEAE